MNIYGLGTLSQEYLVYANIEHVHLLKCLVASFYMTCFWFPSALSFGEAGKPAITSGILLMDPGGNSGWRCEGEWSPDFT